MAILWTYIVLIKYFIEFLSEMVSNRNVTVDKVFKNNLADLLDKEAVAEEE